MNFYADYDQALNLIQLLFKNDKSPFSGQDIDAFMSSSLEEPDSVDRSEHTRWKRHKSVFQCILSRAGYPSPIDLRVEIPRANALITQMNAWAQRQTPPATIPNQTSDNVTIDVACAWFQLIRSIDTAIKADQRGSKCPSNWIAFIHTGNSWVDATLKHLNIFVRENSRGQQFGGYRAIQKYRPYHSPRRVHEVTNEIISHLDAGKIVILDLSAGPVEIRKVLSTRIARQIFERQMETMHAGRVPQNVVLYVEEAHNLIGKNAELTDTWPRIAKEGAKARIAFVFATQEPSSVHPNILANTENSFVDSFK